MFQEHPRAQASVEFMVAIGIVLIIFSMLFAINMFQSQASYDTSLRLSMLKTCNEFATAVNVAANGGSGFSSHIGLQDKIKGNDYILGVSGKTASLSIGQKTVFCRLLTSDISYSNLSMRNMTLENVNGSIKIY